MRRSQPTRIPSAPPHRRARSYGFTLIELMMAMVVSGIVLLGVFAFSSIQQNTANMHHRQVRVQHALDGAMWAIGRDVRMAGLGMTRSCTEVRMWDAAGNRMLNPGATSDPTLAATDPVTGEPYWVLRDGLQAHWRSDPSQTTILGNGGLATSAQFQAPGDSFDVFLGERNFVSALGVFTLAADVPNASSATAEIVLTSLDPGRDANIGDAHDPLDNTNPAHLAAVQQMFPPGSFLLLARSSAQDPFLAQAQGQCMMLQVTGEVQADAGDPQQWRVPIANTSSFNANLAALTGGDVSYGGPDPDDWDPVNGAAGPGGAVGALAIPLGQARWSRYEIRYDSGSQRPFLVRSEFISFIDGVDPTATGTQVYPACGGTECNLPGLHLPDPGTSMPPDVVIGPMIEDMQIAVGCDGYDPNSQAVTTAVPPISPPDLGFIETDGFVTQFNQTVDEGTTLDERRRDEWVGNADGELWAPDCVFYGTGQGNAANWALTSFPSESGTAPGFRMSPQIVRITLVAKPDTLAYQSSDFTTIPAIEDRDAVSAFATGRETFTHTEVFTPRNLRWRTPLM